MKRILVALSLLAALALPASAAKPDFGAQWTGPCGQVGEHQAQSQDHRWRNMMAASNLIHVGFEISGPQFDPDRREVILQECWTPGTFLDSADFYGARLFVTGLIHDSGDHDGYNYHEARQCNGGPLLDKNVIRSWWASFRAYVQANHPGMEIVGGNGKGIQYAATANEGAYFGQCERPSDFVDIYLGIVDHVKPVLHPSWKVIDGMVTGHASRQQMNSRGIGAYLHCNQMTNSECRNSAEDIVQEYGNVWITEDNPPQTDHNHAPERYGICASTPGCKMYITFWSRNSGNPPESTCCWKVGGCNNQTARVVTAVEGCGYVFNDGNGGMFRRAARRLRWTFTPGRAPVGSFPNYRKYNETGCIAGTCDPNWDFDLLSNYIESDEPPPPPPPPPPPGEQCSEGTRIERAECWLNDWRDTGKESSLSKAVRMLVNHHLLM